MYLFHLLFQSYSNYHNKVNEDQIPDLLKKIASSASGFGIDLNKAPNFTWEQLMALSVEIERIQKENESLKASKTRVVELEKLIRLQQEMTTNRVKEDELISKNANPKKTKQRYSPYKRTAEDDDEMEGGLAPSDLSTLRINFDIVSLENESLKSRLTEKEKELSQLRAKVQETGATEQKILLLITEKERLNEEKAYLDAVIAEKLIEIEILKLRASEADRLATQVKHLGNEKTRLNQAVIDKSKEMINLKHKAALIPVLEARLETIQGGRDRLKVVLEQKMKEIDALNSSISEKNELIEEWQNRFSQLEDSYSALRESSEHVTIIQRTEITNIQSDLSLTLNSPCKAGELQRILQEKSPSTGFGGDSIEASPILNPQHFKTN